MYLTTISSVEELARIQQEEFFNFKMSEEEMEELKAEIREEALAEGEAERQRLAEGLAEGEAERQRLSDELAKARAEIERLRSTS